MTPTELLIGQILVVLAIVLFGLWAATQWTASMLGSAATGFVGCGAAVFGSLWRARQSRNVTTYGSARWATSREVERAGMFRDSGVFLGQLDGRYLRHDGSEHVMAFAPTRSGKGVGLVVPTLLGWTGSAVIHDIKGGNWTLTAGWRSRFSHCLLFNPTDARSARYNPLLEVRRGAHEVRDVQNIADILVDPEGALERRSHWEKMSHSLLVGAILHILYAEEEKTLARPTSSARPFGFARTRSSSARCAGVRRIRGQLYSVLGQPSTCWADGSICEAGTGGRLGGRRMPFW